MKYLTNEFAQTLPTPRLLAFYKKLRTHQFYINDWVWDCSCDSCMDIKKRLNEWNTQMTMIKAILDTREHVN